MGEVRLQDWVGRSQDQVDHTYPTPVRALAATLDAAHAAQAQPGDPLPELWHWLYFLPLVPMAEVGTDGHPKRGGFLPPVALERRMWASGRLEFQGDLRVGEPLYQTSRILKVAEKEGKAGRMVFVTVQHAVSSPRGVAVAEEQDIVYVRDARGVRAARPGGRTQRPRLVGARGGRSRAAVPVLGADLQRPPDPL